MAPAITVQLGRSYRIARSRRRALVNLLALSAAWLVLAVLAAPPALANHKCQDLESTLHGTRENDTLTGDSNGTGPAAVDIIAGLAGDDIISGLELDDRLCGGNGHDRIYGGNGNDLLNGGYGIDELNGEAGNDTLEGYGGADTLSGGADDDQLFGRADNDLLFGDDGNDLLRGNAGDDILNGGPGDDRFEGGDGYDTCIVDVEDITAPPVEGSAQCEVVETAATTTTV